jgi:hypothetical protein
MKSFASRIKANSLSDIESINSDEENDESCLIPRTQRLSLKNESESESGLEEEIPLDLE